MEDKGYTVLAKGGTYAHILHANTKDEQDKVMWRAPILHF